MMHTTTYFFNGNTYYCVEDVVTAIHGVLIELNGEEETPDEFEADYTNINGELSSKSFFINDRSGDVYTDFYHIFAHPDYDVRDAKFWEEVEGDPVFSCDTFEEAEATIKALSLRDPEKKFSLNRTLETLWEVFEEKTLSVYQNGEELDD